MISWALTDHTRALALMKKVCYLVGALILPFIVTNLFADPLDASSQVIPIKPPHVIDQPPSKPAETSRVWNLQEADIISVINEVSLETGKNFIIDPRVNGKITLISSKPIKPAEVYDIFLSVLSLLGFSAIPSGDVIKIVPNMESTEYATRVATNHSPGKGDEVVVRIVPLESASANQLIPVIRPLLPQWSNITAYAPGNVLIVAGRASNLERIMSIINNIDKASDSNIEMIPLHQASASQVANVLNNLQNTARANGDTTSITIAADERSNSILLGGNKAARLRIHLLISQLDKPSAGAQGNTEVIYLKYLVAKNFAPILGKIAQNLMGKDGGKDSSVTISAAAANTPPALKKEPENLTNIQAEPSTNSLIITAPPTMIRALNAIVAKLDIRPAQVLVEGIIVEIDQDDLKNLGIQWGAFPQTDMPTQLPGFQPAGLGVVGIIPSMQIQAVLAMLQQNTNINILSTPSVVVLDNHKAILNIGQDVPVQTGQYATTGAAATATPFTTTGYRKVALSLEVTPQLNLGNAVRMLVNLKNDTLQNPSNPGPTPLINTSQIANSVIVNSCDILVIGGLIRNSISDNTEKVPILGDIPGIGLLFQHKTRQLQKRNLVVFIKPVILHNQEDSNAITNIKYSETRSKQISWPVNLDNPGEQKAENILPMYNNNVALPKPFEG